MLDEFVLLFVVVGDCLQWCGVINKRHGYGEFNYGGRRYHAHRLAYELFIGPVPLGAVVLQKCGNRLCVKSEHLELSSRMGVYERNKGVGKFRLIEMNQNRVKITCPRGHAYDGFCRYRSGGGYRYCKRCRNERERRRRAEGVL